MFLTDEFVDNKAKRGISTGGSKKTKHIKFPEKHFLPLIRTRTCAYEWVRNVRFSEILTYLVFLLHPFWDLPPCLISNELEIWKTCGMQCCVVYNKKSIQELLKMSLKKHQFWRVIQISFQVRYYFFGNKSPW